MICRAVLPVALAAFIPLLVASNRMGAQSAVRGAIVGKVTSDSAGSHGVANAEILVPALDINTRTGETGEYRVAVAPGRYLVMVRVPGFKSATDSVTVTAAVDAPLNFVLHAAAVQLDSVVTNATPKKYISGNLNDFEERMHSHGGGSFVGDSVLRQNENRRLPEVLESRLHGVQFFRSILAPPGENPDAVWAIGSRSGGMSACGAFQKCPGAHGSTNPDVCYSSVYVDNVLIYDPRRMPGVIPPDLSMYNTSDVAGVEYYTGGASTPAQFNSNPCGVLAIWTREK